MTQSDRIVEKREFFRLDFTAGLEFKSYQPEEGLESKAMVQNVSQSGVLFSTQSSPPAISSILWMNMDIRTLKICQEIENRALIFNKGLLGKVVRVEEDARTGKSYDVGVCFLTRDQQNSRDVQAILNRVN